jgi:holo-[acyl-carrier protein] synthase
MGRELWEVRVNPRANIRESPQASRLDARAGFAGRSQFSPAGKRRDNTALSEWQTHSQIPLSVGIDVVSVDEVAAALSRFGDRYVRRAFTAHEASYCSAAAAPVSAARFAARFAAKEAALKALQPEDWWADWRAIEVRRQKSGNCALVLHAEAASLAARRGIDHLVLSMSHEGQVAVAVVVAFRAPNREQPERRHVRCHHR